MAAFNLRQSCTFRMRQLEEIENNGKTHITTKTDETGGKMQVQIQENLDNEGHKSVVVTEIRTAKDGKSTDSKKTTAQANPDGSTTVKVVTTSNDVSTNETPETEDPSLQNPI